MMKKLISILILQFFFVGLFAQTASQMSYTILNSSGIRGIDKILQEYKENNNCTEINDAELVEKFKNFSLSFSYNNQLYVLAYDDFDEFPLKRNGKTRGIYLFRKDYNGWHVASKKIFDATYIEGILIDEYIINPSNTNIQTEVLDNDKVLMLIRNRIWVSDLKTDKGYSTSFMNFLILTPKSDTTFNYTLLKPKNKFDFFPEQTSYSIEKNEDFVKIFSKENYVKSFFNGEKLWESEPNLLNLYK